ncbi:MAG: hypothetical protein WBS54_02815 [Acidobacteriota bacterium]
MTHPLVERILAGETQAHVKRAAAKGALPLSREEFIELWVLLRNDEDPEVRIACKESLAALKEEEWDALLPGYEFHPEVLDFAIRVLGKNEQIRRAALKNRGVPVETLEWLGETGGGDVLDLMLDNQVRLLQEPSILEAILRNRTLGTSHVRRIYDLVEQFFRTHPQIPGLLERRFGLKLGAAGGAFTMSVPEAGGVPAGSEAIQPPIQPPAAPGIGAQEPAGAQAELDYEALELPPEALAEEELSAEQYKSLYQQILTMSIPAKIELALKGNKEARGLLIRDSNKVVQEAVLDSPKVSELEIESFARQRNLSEDLFRKLARNKEWTKRYSVVKSLVANPKVPIGLVLQFLPRLTDLDLKLTIKDRNISEAIRREARKLSDTRNSRKVATYKKK